MDVIRWFGFAGGLLLIAGTVGSLTRTLIVPRGLTSRLASAVSRVVGALFLFAADRFEHYRTKDRILAVLGPLTMLGLLAVWLSLFLVGFGLVLWPLVGSLSLAMRESGSSLLTLGFANSPGAATTAVHFVAAATGLIVVALQIAYLPTLYGAFNRREMLVTTLQSRAGIPAWGPEILARHHLVNLLDTMPEFYSDWERWAADVAETHSNYPVLISFRSPHPLRSWVIALLSVMDSAALYHSLAPSTAPPQARICIRMGFTALRDIAIAIQIPFDADPLPTDAISLTFEEFARGVDRINMVGFPVERTAEEAWEDFRGWRVNYELLAYALADRVVAAPALWSGTRARLQVPTIPPLAPIDRRASDTASMEQPRTQTEWRV